MRNKKRKILKTIGLVVLGLGVLGGVIAVTSHFIGKTEVDIHPTFEIGGLNEQGKYKKDEGSLYTKYKFACNGLKATLDFDSAIKYEIFYYDILDNFVSSTGELDEGYNGYAPFNGAYARIEITPTNDEDGKISWTEKMKYSKQLNLKVSKDADKQVKENYLSYKGHCVDVVNDIVDMVWFNDYYLSGEWEWTPCSDNTSFTSKTVLKVDRKSTFKFEYVENLSGSYKVLVFDGLDLENVTKKSYELNTTNNELIVPSGSYVMLTYWNNSKDVSTMLGSLNSQIKIEYNK